MLCEFCGARNDVGSLVCLSCRREVRGASGAAAAAEPEAPVAHADSCPKHPAMPVAGACPRCGAFVCIRCAPGAASGALTCEDCLRRAAVVHDPTVSPFGGPLVLPLLGLVFNTLVFAAAVVTMRQRSGALGPLQLGLVAVTGLMAATLFGLLRRRRWARWSLCLIYLVHVAGGLFTGGPALFWAGWSAVWLGYFLASARAKRTFTG